MTMTTNDPRMDRYARLAEKHWRQYLPSRWAAIPQDERIDFLLDLSEEIANRASTLEFDLRGEDPENEDGMVRMARFNTAHLMAENQALREIIFSQEPEHGTDPLEVPEDPNSPIGQILQYKRDLMELSRELWEEEMFSEDET